MSKLPPEEALPKNRRGSPEAVEKRRLARKLNALLAQTPAEPHGDGRTERRRQRLRNELTEGTRDPIHGLKPIEVLQHVHDLLELGDTVESLREIVTIHPKPHIDAAAARALIESLQRSYNFRPEAYGFLGLSPETLAALPGILRTSPARRGRPPLPR